MVFQPFYNYFLENSYHCKPFEDNLSSHGVLKWTWGINIIFRGVAEKKTKGCVKIYGKESPTEKLKKSD